MGSAEHRIDLQDVSLSVPCYIQDGEWSGTWASSLLGALVTRPRREMRTILRNISFTLHDGDRLALLGRNGAGKTTLLHVLAGAYAPTSGRIEVQGKRQALLNIALGFNGDATVRENVFLRATALGISPRKIRELVPAILEFAELERQANERLYTLSAGQRLRLAFSVTTATQPDILLLDEWISAGDMAFIQKAQNRLKDIVAESRIVVLASHSAELLKSVCNKGLVIEDGEIKFFGEVGEAVTAYRALMNPPKEPVKGASAAGIASKEFVVKQMSNDMPGLGPLPFNYHVLYENRCLKGYSLSEHKAQIEFIGVDAVAASNLLLESGQRSGYSFAGFRSIGHQLSWSLKDALGNQINFSITEQGSSASRVAPSSRGTCHLAWTAGTTQPALAGEDSAS